MVGKLLRNTKKSAAKTISNKKVTLDPDPPKSYAFCSDTVFKPSLAEQLAEVTVLYHEATFLNEHAHLCERTKHSTAAQAAEIAQLANARHLILGHYSTRYKDLEVFREEASTIFDSVHLARDGKVFVF